jgi:HAE1 family hydrophobic/amphiphilic exporter-1
VSANLHDRSLAGGERRARRHCEESAAAGHHGEMAGQQAEMSTSFNSLRFALLLAVFLVYLVMAATFESFVIR